jgi:hypothetical protein
MMNKVKFAFSVCLGVAVLSSTNKSSLALKTNNPSSFAASDFRIAVMTEAEKVAINEKVQAAINSKDIEQQLEGTTASLLIKNGYTVTRFQNKVFGPIKQEGETDIETTKALIEVTTMESGKLPQIRDKYLGNTYVNPSKKKVVLYAPKYLKSATADIEALGVPVAKTPAELFEQMSKIGK